MLRETKRRAGMTLVELLIVVSIIGILASVAIPSFVKQKNVSKRSEAFTNLAAIARSNKSYFAEYGVYVSVDKSEPTETTGNPPGVQTRDFSGVTRFDLVGWVPEGQVFYDYDINTPAIDPGSCTCAGACFTAAAYGDVDGKNGMSVILFAAPDPAGGFCGSYLLGKLPPVNPDGDRRVNEPVRTIDTDEF